MVGFGENRRGQTEILPVVDTCVSSQAKHMGARSSSLGFRIHFAYARAYHSPELNPDRRSFSYWEKGSSWGTSSRDRSPVSAGSFIRDMNICVKSNVVTGMVVSQCGNDRFTGMVMGAMLS